MTSPTTKRDALQPEAEGAGPLFADWFDPIETALRDRVRESIETMISSELDAALARPRYARRPAGEGGDGVAAEVVGHRHGRRTRTLIPGLESSDLWLIARSRTGRPWAKRSSGQDFACPV